VAGARPALAALVILAAAATAAGRTPVPDFAPGGAVALGAVSDGDTLALADGRRLRLVSIETPASADLAARAKEALEKLVAGKPLELRYAGSATDRAGRVVAELYAGGRWVQRELVRRGLARVHGAADNRLGLAQLLAAEDSARQARRGLWRLRSFAVRPAEDAARDAGTWQIVAGTVADAALVEDGAWLDFSADRSTGFAVHLDRDAVKLARAAGLDPLSLKGARVRVRGFIDGTRRPTIAVTFPEQIERLAPVSGAQGG
jgi:micrococcal nuclease